VQLLEEAGFEHVEFRLLAGSIVAVHTGVASRRLGGGSQRAEAPARPAPEREL
jgi:hypothetical protein